jgi:hypothetical protein
MVMEVLDGIDLSLMETHSGSLSGDPGCADERFSSEPIWLTLMEAPVTATPVAALPLAERPIYLVDSSFSNRPLLSNIFMIDPDQARVVWSITTRYMPEATLSPDGKRLFVADSYWTEVTRGEQRDVLSVYDAHSGEVLIDDIPIQGRVIYKGMPSARNPYLFFSLDGEQLFLAKDGAPDISRLRLVVFNAHTLAFQDEGDWPACNPPQAALYARQACEALASPDPRQQLSEKIPFRLVGASAETSRFQQMGSGFMRDTTPASPTAISLQMSSSFMTPPH